MQEILNLSPVGQKELLDKLTRHAWCKMRRLIWRGAVLKHKDGAASGLYGPEDFAIDAIKLAIDGKRNWNREKYPTLDLFLYSVIESRISATVRKLDNRKVGSLPTAEVSDEMPNSYDVAGDEPEPINIIIDGHWLAEFHKFRNDALKELDREPMLLKLFECLDAGITQPIEIAELLGTSVNDINAAKKRLRRRLEKLYLQLGQLSQQRMGS